MTVVTTFEHLYNISIDSTTCRVTVQLLAAIGIAVSYHRQNYMAWLPPGPAPCATCVQTHLRLPRFCLHCTCQRLRPCTMHSLQADQQQKLSEHQ